MSRAPSSSRRLRTLLGLLPSLVAAALLLGWAIPSPAVALATLRHPVPGDPTGPVVAGVGLLAWLLAGYLVLVLLLTGSAQVGGATGRLARDLLRRAAPRTIRQAAAALLGVGLALGPGGVAQAAGPLPGFDWLPNGPVATAPATTPATTPATVPATPTHDLAPDPGTVTVQPGDTLWDLAAADLPGADDRAVAGAWPSWWSANRSVIGNDPGLLRPGQELVRPTSPSGQVTP